MHMASWMCVSNDQPRSLSLPTASMDYCETIGNAIEIAKIDKITWRIAVIHPSFYCTVYHSYSSKIHKTLSGPVGLSSDSTARF